MSNIEFKAWDKITRENPFKVTISEKINGTNACVIINGGTIVGVQSRKRLITPEDDNFGFAAWVEENRVDLETIGDGYHYGEWAGPGIQKNPHNLDRKRLFLFNTFRWSQDRPKCCDVVPILFEGIIEGDTIQNVLNALEKNANPGETPEGVVIYYHAFRKYTKHTLISPNGKWCKD